MILLHALTNQNQSLKLETQLYKKLFQKATNIIFYLVIYKNPKFPRQGFAPKIYPDKQLFPTFTIGSKFIISHKNLPKLALSKAEHAI